ncbi:DUF6460 domain-containing protein [Methylocapsa aurea]|uniref:DUF6460 domain-containing protein n=1 Tax=Methylocapsa aurea TaxID=663610 RepID=UPI000A05B961|nr:DUF6460 domain-containing protein [Methylocapsa aurea]
MSDDHRSAPDAPPHWPGASSGPTEPHWRQDESRARKDEPPLNRFLGGSPGSVFLRLLFVSLIVGAFLMWFDIRPQDIFRGVIDLINRIWALGFDAIREVANYIIVGAAIVVPVWLALRLLNMRDGR